MHTSSLGQTLLLVDGSSYLYRAFHAGGNWSVRLPDGSVQPTGALRIMINMMQALLREVRAHHGACVFDDKGPTFRHALYPDYKAHRAPMPEDLRSQIAPIHDMVRLLGWRVLCVPGVEADDVLGTLARLGSAQGMDVVISSGDKDLSQLVNERVTIIDTMSGKRRDVAGVQAEFGVPPERMLDWQTLVGDAADNVPGVDKVGPKTAAKWLAQYGSLDALVEHADEVGGAAGQSLRRALPWLPTGRKLLSIQSDCDLSAHVQGLPALDALALQAPDEAALHAFYTRYAFTALAQKTAPRPAAQPHADALDAAPSPAAASGAASRYETINTWADFERWLGLVQAAELTAIDTETTSLDAMQARIVGLSLSVQAGQAAYIALAHEGMEAGVQLPLEAVLARLKPWLQDASCAKLGQHIKYDLHVFANHGIEVRGYAHDTMLQSYVLEAHMPHGLESLALRHLQRSAMSYEALCGRGAQQKPFAQISVQQASIYACEDADFTLQVHQRLWPQLQNNEKLRAIYALEIDTSAVLCRIERCGVCVRAQPLQRQSHELGSRMLALQAKAHALAQHPFNLSSPKQVGEVLFGQLGLPVIKKTATGSPSTNEEVLEQLAQDYPLPQAILEYRTLAKLKNTYTDKLPGMAHPVTGRVHTHYAQAVAVTGRLSSNEPNLQNIPVRTEEGRRIREAFVAAPGCLIASADYSQIELRIMAHISQDAALLHAFESAADVHRATAAEIFGIAPEQVSNEQRRYAKVINFGLIYGMGSFGLAKTLGIDHTAAKNYIERYFERYPGVRAYMQRTREQAAAQGWVETIFGRRLYLPEIRSPNAQRRAAAQRAAINAPMQGSAADLIKMSMVEIARAIDAQGKATRMIMQVHDELVFELPEGEAPWVRSEIPRIMASVATLRVPLLATLGFGQNWEEAH